MDETIRQLPRGRHGLAREEVVASQRARLSVAVVDAVAQYGYYGTTVAHIVRGARVSRETFYEHFSSKDACFSAAIEASAEEMAALVGGAVHSTGTPLERLDAVVGAYLDWLVAHPTAAHCLLLELRNAGPEMTARGAEWTDAFIGMLVDLFGGSIDRFEGELFVAGLMRVVAVRLEAGHVEALPQIREPLLRAVRRYHDAPDAPEVAV